MRRIRLKKRIHIFKKTSKLSKILLILFLILICVFILIKYINSKVNPVLLNYAEIESRKLASIVINNAVSRNVTEVNVDELFLITKDSNGEIKTIDFNPIMVNKILTQTTNNVQLNLKYIEQGKIEQLNISNNYLIDYDYDKLKKGIIYEIPSGVVFGYSILANIGPKIPVKLNLLGDIVGYINTKVTNYGINNALVEVNIILELTEQVILPFVASKVKIETSIPIAMKLIQGSIPNYYLNGIDSNSTSIALPIE